nr:MAG TPA: hypothetical protein [Caudoviricetes sp.]
MPFPGFCPRKRLFLCLRQLRQRHPVRNPALLGSDSSQLLVWHKVP